MGKIIAVENSTWNNIGDAFYQISLEQCMRDSLPGAQVVSFDGPFQRAFRPRGFTKNGYDARFATQADHFVFSGPILGEGFFVEYAPLIEKIVGDGKSYSLLSVHAYAEGDLLEQMRAFLRKHPPLAMQTRDNFTYKKFSDLDFPSYDGICFAFFVSRLSGIPTIAPKTPYLAVSYHSGPDPQITVDGDKENITDAVAVKQHYVKNWRLARHLDFRRNYPSSIGGYDIIRPVHGFYPFPHLSFARPASFITYNPLNFLAIYKGCKAVITDRVHAGVAALSFGNPARVASLDSRFAIFEQAPVVRDREFLRIDAEELNKEHDKVSNWLADTFALLTK